MKEWNTANALVIVILPVKTELESVAINHARPDVNAVKGFSMNPLLKCAWKPNFALHLVSKNFFFELKFVNFRVRNCRMICVMGTDAAYLFF